MSFYSSSILGMAKEGAAETGIITVLMNQMKQIDNHKMP